MHDLLPDGRLFVPCRHEHGHGTKDKEDFDHEIFSVNTQGEAAGDTRDEKLKMGFTQFNPVFILSSISPSPPPSSHT